MRHIGMRHSNERFDDEILVRRVLSGERRAFATLLERHRGGVLRTCVRLLASEPDAQDIVQEASLRAFLDLKRLREPSRFGAWLHSVAVNLARSELRRRRFTQESLYERERRGAPLVDASPGPEEVRLARELHAEVLAALSELSEVNREAVSSYYLEGHTCAELAELWGVPVGTVKGRLHKGRRRLAPALEPAAEQVLGRTKEEKVARAEEMVEVVVDDVLKFSVVDDENLEALRSGSMQDLHEASVRTAGWQRRPGAAVLLRETEGKRVLPVFVGLTDALSIWRSAAGWDPPRPFAHDLMGRLLEGSGLRVEGASVLLLADNVFYGEVALAGENGEQRPRRVDARPSDAVALAVRADARIHVAEDLFEEDGFRSKEAFMERWAEELGLG